jgi:4'-phosphopantetheinyl transferase
MLDLPSGQVDLWFTRTDRVDTSLATQYRSLLTPNELAQHARFCFEKDRHRYLVTRALAREVLSRYAPVDPRDWRFEADRYGKPCIVGPAGFATPIAFNISHTDGLVIVGVTSRRALGVDVECMQRHAVLEVADRYFSAPEVRFLRRLPVRMQALRFWELWTLKESYIKARGMGLSIPLDQFAFDLDAPHIAIEFEPGFDDLPSRWQFRQMRLTPHHMLALCIAATAGHETPVRLSVRETVPLRDHRIDRCADPCKRLETA